MGLRRVIIEGDVLSIIRRVQTTKEDRSVICSYIHDIKTLSRVFEECRFKKVFRSGNGVAYELAKEEVRSLRSTDLDYQLPRKALIPLEEDVRHQEMSKEVAKNVKGMETRGRARKVSHSRDILSGLEDRVVTLEESMRDIKERIDDVDDRLNDGLQSMQE
ncbi:hypothetical protein Goshw_017895 [Gossypium schwendimanii]|uniref:RNase H type-1 domain-containing protein n=1 Tax=Gossypium schwendimanii TaxID=34291 RepID=A0A7J9LHJ5_GOSSC|nr:hypothetical protein [Gossypium schwendimanii]